MTSLLSLGRRQRHRAAGSTATRGVRTLGLLLALLLAAGLADGCGHDPSPGEAVPALADRLERVDAAIEAGNYRKARYAVEALATETARAEEAGDLSAAEADRILTAARAVLAQLPADPSDTPAENPEPKPPTDSPGENDTAPGESEQGQDHEEDEDDD